VRGAGGAGDAGRAGLAPAAPPSWSPSSLLPAPSSLGALSPGSSLAAPAEGAALGSMAPLQAHTCSSAAMRLAKAFDRMNWVIATLAVPRSAGNTFAGAAGPEVAAHPRERRRSLAEYLPLLCRQSWQSERRRPRTGSAAPTASEPSRDGSVPRGAGVPRARTSTEGSHRSTFNTPAPIYCQPRVRSAPLPQTQAAHHHIAPSPSASLAEGAERRTLAPIVITTPPALEKHAIHSPQPTKNGRARRCCCRCCCTRRPVYCCLGLRPGISGGSTSFLSPPPLPAPLPSVMSHASTPTLLFSSLETMPGPKKV
jgi:hypothetical protein